MEFPISPHGALLTYRSDRISFEGIWSVFGLGVPEGFRAVLSEGIQRGNQAHFYSYIFKIMPSFGHLAFRWPSQSKLSTKLVVQSSSV